MEMVIEKMCNYLSYSPEVALKVFAEQVKRGSTALLLTRHSYPKINKKYELEDIITVILKIRKNGNPISLEEFQRIIEVFLKMNSTLNKGIKSIILLDDLNYLIEHNNFRDVLKTIYQINDIAVVNNSCFFTVLNSSSLSSKQSVLLEREFIFVEGDYNEG